MEFSSENFAAFLAIALATKEIEAIGNEKKSKNEQFYFSCDFDGAKVTFTCEDASNVSIRFKGFSKIGGENDKIDDSINVDKDTLQRVKDCIGGDSDISEVFDNMEIEDNSIKIKINDGKYSEDFSKGKELKNFLAESDINKKLVFVLDEKLVIGKIFGNNIKNGTVSFEGDAGVKCLKDKDNNVLADEFIKKAIEDFIKVDEGTGLTKNILQKIRGYVKITVNGKSQSKLTWKNDDIPENLKGCKAEVEKKINEAIENVKQEDKKPSSLIIKSTDGSKVEFKVKWEEAEETINHDDSMRALMDFFFNGDKYKNNLFKIFNEVRSKVRYKGNDVVFLSGFSDIFGKSSGFVELLSEKKTLTTGDAKNAFRKRFKEEVRKSLLGSNGQKVFGQEIKRNQRETLHDFLRTAKSKNELQDKEYKFMKSVILDNPEIMNEVKTKVVDKNRVDRKGVRYIKTVIQKALKKELGAKGIKIDKIEEAVEKGSRLINSLKKNDPKRKKLEKSVEGLKKIPEGFFIKIKCKEEGGATDETRPSS